jgi:hypothetical protein
VLVPLGVDVMVMVTEDGLEIPGGGPIVIRVDGKRDGVTRYVTLLTPGLVMLRLKTGIYSFQCQSAKDHRTWGKDPTWVVVMSGNVTTITVVLDEPETQLSVMVVVTGGNVMVVVVVSVYGGKTISHGGMHVTTGVGIDQMLGSMYTGGPAPADDELVDKQAASGQ